MSDDTAAPGFIDPTAGNGRQRIAAMPAIAPRPTGARSLPTVDAPARRLKA